MCESPVRESGDAGGERRRTETNTPLVVEVIHRLDQFGDSSEGTRQPRPDQTPVIQSVALSPGRPAASEPRGARRSPAASSVAELAEASVYM